MKGDIQKIEKHLRSTPRPPVPSHLLEKLKSDVSLTAAGSARLQACPTVIQGNRSTNVLTIWRFLKSNRLNLGGLGLAWSVILLCRITLPDIRQTTTLARTNQPSTAMVLALEQENRRLLLVIGHSMKKEAEGG
jgi:hypothetical protein